MKRLGIVAVALLTVACTGGERRAKELLDVKDLGGEFQDIDYDSECVDLDTTLSLLDLDDGSEQWTTPIPYPGDDQVVAMPGSDGQIVVGASGDQGVDWGGWFAVDLATGTPRWQSVGGDVGLYQRNVSSGSLVQMGSDDPGGRMTTRRISAADGSDVWEVGEPTDFVVDAATGKVVQVTGRQYRYEDMVARDADTGDELWSTPNGDFAMLARGDGIYRLAGGSLTRLDPLTGRQIWAATAESSMSFDQLIESNGVALVTWYDGWQEMEWAMFDTEGGDPLGSGRVEGGHMVDVLLTEHGAVLATAAPGSTNESLALYPPGNADPSWKVAPDGIWSVYATPWGVAVVTRQTTGGFVTALELFDWDGSSTWRWVVPEPGLTPIAVEATADSILVGLVDDTGQGGSSVISLDPETGKVRWQSPTDRSVGQLAVTDRGLLAVVHHQAISCN